MLIATEGVVVAVLIMVLAGLFIVVAEVRVVLDPMCDGLRHMRPLVQVQYAEGVESKRKCEEGAHGVQKYTSNVYRNTSGFVGTDGVGARRGLGLGDVLS